MSDETPPHTQQLLAPEDRHILAAYADDFSSDSDADGGMYLDLEDPEAALYYPTDGDPEFGPQQIIREDSDANRFSSRAPLPYSYSQQSQTGPQVPSGAGEVGPEKKSPENYRPYIETEEEHAALTVLNDPELLAMYASKSSLSIPQTRRRFTAKWLAKGDKELEHELVSASFTVPAEKAHLVPMISQESIRSGYIQTTMGLDGSTTYLVPGEWKMRVDRDMSGWWHPGHPRSRDPRGFKHGGASRSGSESGHGRRKSARRGYEEGVQFEK